MEKQVSLAVELAANPAILFLHDPFVGMDVQQMLQFAAILKVRWAMQDGPCNMSVVGF